MNTMTIDAAVEYLAESGLTRAEIAAWGSQVILGTQAGPCLGTGTTLHEALDEYNSISGEAPLTVEDVAVNPSHVDALTAWVIEGE